MHHSFELVINVRHKYISALKNSLATGPMSGTKGIQPLLVDPTQVESKKFSQIQWPVPSINAELVEVFPGE